MEGLQGLQSLMEKHTIHFSTHKVLESRRIRQRRVYLSSRQPLPYSPLDHTYLTRLLCCCIPKTQWKYSAKDTVCNSLCKLQELVSAHDSAITVVFSACKQGNMSSLAHSYDRYIPRSACPISPPSRHFRYFWCCDNPISRAPIFAALSSV